MSFRDREELARFLTELEKGEGQKFFSLEETLRVLQTLHNPQNNFRSIHLVGTNGKGSVGAILAAIFRASGVSVGHAPSPHLFDRTERCLINGRPCDKETYLSRIQEVFESAAKVSLDPSFFVLTFAASMVQFSAEQVKWGIIEAGLGGIDDATNCLANPVAAVITSVGYDHMKMLGNTLGEIAEKKAGIAKRGVPMFIGEVPAEALQRIVEIAEGRGAPLEIAGRDFRWLPDRSLLLTKESELRLDLSGLALRGAFQLRNAVLAARTAYALGCDEEAVHRGIATVRWPGRCELFALQRADRTQSVLLDVAHNEEGTRILRQEIESYLPTPKRLVSVVSMLDRKDHRAALSNLIEMRETMPGTERLWICTSSHHLHARPPEELADFLRENGEDAVLLEASPTRAFSDALAEAERQPGNSLIVITGSMYLVSKLRPLCTELPFRTIVTD